MLVHITNLIDDAKCFETVRQLRWPDGVICPQCRSRHVTKDATTIPRRSGNVTSVMAAIAASMICRGPSSRAITSP